MTRFDSILREQLQLDPIVNKLKFENQIEFNKLNDDQTRLVK